MTKHRVPSTPCEAPPSEGKIHGSGEKGARPRFSCTVVRSTEAFDADGWVSRYVAHVIALYQAIERKEAA